MKLTIRKDIDFNSIILKHNILLQATNLVMGREGALQTEKELYLILAILDNVCEENVIEECNDDERNLASMIMEDIEPFFNEVMKNEWCQKLYNETKELFLQRCKEIWDNQHSIMGILDTILMALQNLTDEDKKEVLKGTAKIAEAAFDRRTQEMTEKVDEANAKIDHTADKLEEFVRKYQEHVNQPQVQTMVPEKRKEENKIEENNAV